jgi:DNA-binding MarR family transcriptional regulator
VTSPDAPGAPPEVRDELVRLLRAHAVEAERLGQVFAERNGMHPTDLQALLAVMQAEAAGAPLTPGRLGEHLGLSSGATTAVVDRLERADHVRRERDDRDRRRITLHYGAAAAAVGGAFFGPLGARIECVLAGFTPDELAVVRRFLEQTNAVMRAHREAVTSANAGAAGVTAAGAASTAAGAAGATGAASTAADAAGAASTAAGAAGAASTAAGAAGAASTAAGVSAAGAASTDVAAR